jgi:hypothetical protein
MILHSLRCSLLDNRVQDGVLIRVLVTSILGPVLTQHLAPRMLQSVPDCAAPDATRT